MVRARWILALACVVPVVAQDRPPGAVSSPPPAVEVASTPGPDWLVSVAPLPARALERSLPREVELTNGLIRRVWRIDPVRFEPPGDAPQGLVVLVHYALYDVIPVIAKWFEIRNGADRAVTL